MREIQFGLWKLVLDDNDILQQLWRDDVMVEAALSVTIKFEAKHLPVMTAEAIAR